MSYEFFISWKYLTAKRPRGFMSLISVISILGVAVGVMALIVVLAVMAGFDNDLKEKIIGANSHILIESLGGAPFENSEQMIEKIEELPQVLGASPIINGQVIIRNHDRARGVILRGIDPEREPQVTRIREYLERGELPHRKGQLMLGSELADSLGLELGKGMSVISGVGGKRFDFQVCGIFTSGMYDYDMNLAFSSIVDAQSILGMPGRATGVGVRIEDPYRAKEVGSKIIKIIGFPYLVRSWMEINKTLFSALKLEKTTMFLILTLIVIVACFNIVSTLVMMVTEKTKDIGILKSIGATNSSIRAIFTLEGFTIGLTGTCLGLGGGLGLSYLLKRYQFIRLPKEIYYIDRLPVQVQWADSALIVIAAILISLLATLYPAWKASRLDPVEALRYE